MCGVNDLAGAATTAAVFRAVKKRGAVTERLSAQSVADIVKDYAERVGLDSRAVRKSFRTKG